MNNNLTHTKGFRSTPYNRNTSSSSSSSPTSTRNYFNSSNNNSPAFVEDKPRRVGPKDIQSAPTGNAEEVENKKLEISSDLNSFFKGRDISTEQATSHIIEKTHESDTVCLKSVNRTLQIYGEIIASVTSRIGLSHTAMRVNFTNEIKEQNRYIITDTIKGIRDKIEHKDDFSLSDIKQFLEWVREDNPWRKYNQSSDVVKSVLNDQTIRKIIEYFETKDSYARMRNEYENSSNEVSRYIFYLTCAVKRSFAVCHSLANWVFIKLLSHPGLNESIKSKIRIAATGKGEAGNEHAFVVIVDEDNDPIIVLDPWLKYIKVKTNQSKFSSDGFYGPFKEYIEIFNSIADGETLKKLEESNICYLDNPCTSEQSIDYNKYIERAIKG